MRNISRREFVKNLALGVAALGFLPCESVFAAGETKADLVVYGKVTREQALTAMTMGCAMQMFIENERGSIRPGKYADFLLVDKVVLTCPAGEIHNAKPAATYFEGKKVFSRE